MRGVSAPCRTAARPSFTWRECVLELQRWPGWQSWFSLLWSWASHLILESPLLARKQSCLYRPASTGSWFQEPCG